ncbi:MarR family transcriptional regulator (plasmid) [Haloferax mediterranei ATCC 33500]|uniref:MarR family transcriptional regulator n=1 Tax=Haloferax mediterranei (strain ATCC 33500 / DSM 1411 / JCM 8866 / NBRC 14739 / NCIMB 2177 / R-4) TaxID=523841 RepID=I3R9T3_HALMT|nr:helix-turn-helix domain-containing protein [Haloferax mediterranei]AFK20993.1 hypothetical protein HFX_5159 [Haloferax mediterranei ATCC 33500]EMA05222.1 hypothetical protein C439_00445 [Haloferax mediterranei ATCC 33500]MDX5989974.1 helix-turn-helix domain-containing protein [Haloferax mediterranei ATCC 33500]QCQ77358.1 MarR family transcriptional regulator [Haloferax mediterranei ATCC 33500]
MGLIVFITVFASVLPATVVAEDSVEVRAVDHSGPGVIATQNERTYVASWQPSTVSVAIAADHGTYDVCLKTELNDGSTTTLECQRLQNTSVGSEQRVNFDIARWPGNATGEQVLTTVVRPSDGGSPAAQASRTITVLATEGDADGDNLGNKREVERGTSVLVTDTDTDGLTDGDEVNRYETDPTNTDSDSDELSDGVEVNELGSNPTEKDTDSDGLVDGAEATTYGTDPTVGDTDGDNLDDGPEVNTYETNPTVTDTDGDGLADGPEVNVHETDPTAADTDGDGLNDGEETNRYETNPTKSDTDGDGLNDGREVTVIGTNPNRGDTDGDGRGDGTEVDAGTDPSSTVGSVLRSLGIDARFSMLALVVGGGALVILTVLAVLGGVVLSKRYAHFLSSNSRVGRYLQRREKRETDTVSDAETLTQPQVEELLDDEARVLKLLDESDGQLRQSAVVEGTGWSKSKVSRVLSQMDEEGVVKKINVGRENLIIRPENVPEHARSPFEES